MRVITTNQPLRVRYDDRRAKIVAGAGGQRVPVQRGPGRTEIPRGGVNTGLLADMGEPKGATRAVRRTRRAYAHVVGGSDELRMAGLRLRSRARQNAKIIRVSGDLYRSIKMRRDRSAEGIPVDYEVYSDDPQIGPIEWGFMPKGAKSLAARVPGHHVMANAARGVGPVKWRKKGDR